MRALAHQRCLNHVGREAVARCPECGHFFCRECITEHDDRIICSSCLRKLTAPPAAKPRKFTAAWCALAAVAGLWTAWIFFFLVGHFLVQIPSKFHEGTVWQNELSHLEEDEK
jgi:hypothetical protein